MDVRDSLRAAPEGCCFTLPGALSVLLRDPFSPPPLLSTLDRGDADGPAVGCVPLLELIFYVCQGLLTRKGETDRDRDSMEQKDQV